jgi:bacterioferritin-associated ferredoxin
VYVCICHAVTEKDIQKAIKGMIVMSSDLDAMFTCFLNLYQLII